MAKKKHVEQQLHYKKIIEKQKSIIKKLSKQAGRGEKVKERYDDLEQELMEQIREENNKQYLEEVEKKCPECKKGNLELVDLKIRKMLICDKCQYRLITKT